MKAEVIFVAEKEDFITISVPFLEEKSRMFLPCLEENGENFERCMVESIGQLYSKTVSIVI